MIIPITQICVLSGMNLLILNPRDGAIVMDASVIVLSQWREFQQRDFAVHFLMG